MSVKFTADQQKAIDLRQRNILVSAAAGSGKTAVLTERIVKMICDEEHPVDVDRLLVVTFTKAAAAEMRERISRRLVEILNEDSGNEHLQRQAALLHNAQITTIDSFCQFILRNNFEDIGLDPGFRVASEGEIEFLKKEVLDALLEEKFAEGSESFHHCLEFFCPNGKEKQIEEHILNLHRVSLSYPFPEDWLSERKTDYAFRNAEEWKNSSWMVFLSNHIQKSILGLSEELERAISVCNESDGPWMYLPTLETEAAGIRDLCKTDDFMLLREKLPLITWGRLSSKRDGNVSDEKKEIVKDIRKKAKDFIEKIQKDFFAVSDETHFAEMAECNAAIGELTDLCLAFSGRVTEKKREKKLIDFSDMEHLALQILVCKDENGTIHPTKTALEYRDYFAEVLIDEYQDSNEVQEYLLNAVSGEERGKKNRFMVGDVKQSIYKFRLARPDLFLDKYNRYATEDGEERRIDLHQNFRSRKEVLDTVNTVFSKLMGKDIGGIVYDDAAALYLGADYPENEGCESEFLLVEKPSADEDEDAKEAEARAVCERILELKKNFKVTERMHDENTGEEKSILRPLRYRDIAVLVRSQSGYGEAFKKVFEEFGIPLYAAGGEGYFSVKEIRDVLEFIRVLDNPRQDIPLFTVMKSVFGGFSDEELALIRAGSDKTKTLYENVSEKAEAGEEKCIRFLEKIRRYRACAVYMTIREILEMLFKEHNYLAHVAARSTGAGGLANVKMLLTKAQEFEKNSYYGLFHFVRYIEQMKKFDMDLGEAVTLDENADVVRLMTIHKSKGLEFPVAIVAGMGKKFNRSDYSGAFITDTDLGIGTDYVNIESRYKRKTLRKKVIATKMSLDNLAEELRILYVAMTRAREKLILSACVKDPEKALAKRSGQVNYYTLSRADGYLPLLLLAFPEITCVTLPELCQAEVRDELEAELKKEQLMFAENLADREKMQNLQARLEFVYPYAYLKDVYTKTSVSELKMKAILATEEEAVKELFEEEETVPYIPAFMRGGTEVSGAARGSAMHRLMELLDFTKAYETQDDIRVEMDRFLQEGRLEKAYYDIIRIPKILQFLQSPLGQRMKEAQKQDNLFREQPFVIGVLQTETVLVQGIIDAYFEEDGEIVLMDYKTDAVNTPEELTERYHVQMEYYEKALLSLTGKKVKEKILYSFHLGKEVPIQDAF